MNDTARDALQAGARTLGGAITLADADRLIAHLDLLDEWGARMNLTAIRERPAQVTRHLLDSLSVRPYLAGVRIADVGSGAGFPGIPLAIVEPARHFTLIESTGKKCRFLEHVRDALGLVNVEVLQARAEACRPAVRHETVLARAVAPVAELVRVAGPLVSAGGRLLAMKGRYPAQELDAKLNGWKIEAVHQLFVPGLDEERHLVVLCRSHDKTV